MTTGEKDANSEGRIPLSEGMRSLPRKLAALAAMYAVLGAVVTLVGWAKEMPRLTDWLGTNISMFPNSAVSALACGFGLVVLLGAGLKRAWARWLIRCAAAVAIVLGGLTLWEHVSGTNLEIDTLLFDAEWGQEASVSPMRIGVPASLSFLLLGLALGGTTGSARCRRRTAFLALLPVVIASLSIVGYWFGASQLFGIARYTGIAFQTSTIVAALGVGIVAAVEECGITAFLMKPDAGGVVARRLFLPMVGIPVVLGWIRILGKDAGWYDDAFGTAIRTLLEVGVFLGFLGWAARSISVQATVARVASEERGVIEQRFFRFMQSLPGLAWIKDGEGRYVYANDAAMKAFQTRAEDLYGFTDMAILPEDTARMFMENDRLAARQAEGLQFVETLRHGDGELYSSLVTKFPIPGPGAARPLVGGIAIDITDRLRAEEALRDAGRKKDEFLATLAHELRNPLSPIQFSVEICRAGVDKEKREWALGVIDRQVEQMSRLIDDLLDVSRISYGKLTLRPERVELARVVASSVETTQPLRDQVGQTLEVDLPERAIPLHADPVRLEQVFANLLNNAARYGGEKTRVTIRATTEGETVSVSVRDNGAGIPAERLTDIFEMFSQVKTGPNVPQGGLGIGLALVQGLVRLHSGRIEARSDGAGKGSEFLVHLPLHPDAAQVAVPVVPELAVARARSNGHAPMRLLIADDLRDNADSLADCFRAAGYEVRTAYDGAEALAVAEDFRPQVMLLDIGMPELGGDQVCARTRETEWGKTVFMVAITGWGQPGDRRLTSAVGFDHHLVKPVRIDELLALVGTRGAKGDPAAIEEV